MPCTVNEHCLVLEKKKWKWIFLWQNSENMYFKSQPHLHCIFYISWFLFTKFLKGSCFFKIWLTRIFFQWILFIHVNLEERVCMDSLKSKMFQRICIFIYFIIFKSHLDIIFNFFFIPLAMSKIASWQSIISNTKNCLLIIIHNAKSFLVDNQSSATPKIALITKNPEQQKKLPFDNQLSIWENYSLTINY